MNDKKIIRIRRGVNGYKYAACDSKGNFLRNFQKLSDVRKHWKQEIKAGHIELVRELDRKPDFTAINETIKTLESIIRSYGHKNKK